MESAALRSGARLPRPARAGLAAALLALAAGAWALTADRMAGMDAGPGGALGGLGWFAVSWLVMMAAMMLPSLVPAALGSARAGGRTVAAFVTGYLAAWTAAGLVAYGALAAVRALDVAFLGWDRAGRYVAAAAILLAAGYQLTAAKAGCLDHCRAPATARAPGGGLRSGLRHGAACVSCCAGLTAALFALGAMSLTWMVAVAALIAAERLLPWRAPAVYGVAAALAVLAIWMAVAPADLPGLTIPGAMGGGMRSALAGPWAYLCRM
jgi:predicted metal-binding membrane protein